MNEVTVRISRPRFVALALLAGFLVFAPSAASAQTPSATLTGYVYSASTGEPVEGARVEVQGTNAVTLTDASGLFRIAGLPAGRHGVSVTYLGLESKKLLVDLRRGATEDLSLGLEMDVIPLTELYVTVERDIPVSKLYGFYKRKRAGHGYYMTRKDIVEHNVPRSSDLLRRVPGMTLGAHTYGGRAPRQRVRGEVCQPQYYLDGSRAPNFDIDYIDPQDIAAMEVYRGTSETPGRFKSFYTHDKCGVVVLWTREAGRGHEHRE